MTNPDVRVSLDPKRGEKESFNLKIGDLPNGGSVLMPVTTIRGQEDGPVFFLNACLHGDEILGSDVVRRVLARLQPKELRGTLLAVPVANPTAVATRTRRNILEMYPGPHDLNRVFPGIENGIISERTAYVLTENFVAEADYVLDVHSTSVGGQWEPIATVATRDSCPSDEVYESSAALASSFGTDSLLHGPTYPGSLVEVAIARGTAATLAEFGVANVIDQPNRDLGIRGVLNSLKHAGMIDGSPEVPAQQLLLGPTHALRTDVGGYLILEFEVGTNVDEGTKVAFVENLEGEVLAEFVAPVTGRICRINTMGVVGTGDLVCQIAETTLR